MSTPLVATPHVIYVLVEDRAAFDKIAMPATDNGAGPRGHVLTKCVEQGGVRVIFQYWIEYIDPILAAQVDRMMAEVSRQNGKGLLSRADALAILRANQPGCATHEAAAKPQGQVDFASTACATSSYPASAQNPQPFSDRATEPSPSLRC